MRGTVKDNLIAARKPTEIELELLRLVGGAHCMDHEDKRLAKFCNDKADTDIFNECHNEGWLRTTHDPDISWSGVHITPEGRRAISESTNG